MIKASLEMMDITLDDARVLAIVWPEHFIFDEKTSTFYLTEIRWSEEDARLRRKVAQQTQRKV